MWTNVVYPFSRYFSRRRRSRRREKEWLAQTLWWHDDMPECVIHFSRKSFAVVVLALLWKGYAEHEHRREIFSLSFVILSIIEKVECLSLLRDGGGIKVNVKRLFDFGKWCGDLRLTVNAYAMFDVYLIKWALASLLSSLARMSRSSDLPWMRERWQHEKAFIWWVRVIVGTQCASLIHVPSIALDTWTNSWFI